MLIRMLSEIFRNWSANVMRILQLLQGAVVMQHLNWFAVYANIYIVRASTRTRPNYNFE